jgi:hypothetical protein
MSIDEEKKYQAALETHKHYDNLSLTICIGMIAVVGACFSIYSNIKFPRGGALVFFAGAVIIGFLFWLYRKCAISALIARNYSAELEREDIPYGVSWVLVHINDPPEKELRQKFLPNMNKGLGLGWVPILLFAIALCAFLIIAGVCVVTRL